MSARPAGHPTGSGLAGQNGAVLVLVLVVMAIGVGLAFHISGIARDTVRSASLLEDKLRAKLEAESELELLHYLLATNPFQHAWVTVLDRQFEPSLPEKLTLLGEPMQWHNSVITLRDTASMLTVPWCDPDFMQRYLRARGIANDKAAQAADSWIDWLDRDDFKHLNGAETFDYHLEGITAWTPRNSLALQAREEPALVLGLQSSEVWKQLEPEVVWTVRGGSNINTASESMLEALFDIPREQAVRLVNRRREMGLLTNEDVFQITGKSSRPARGKPMEFPNYIVAIHIRTTIGEAGEHVHAVIDFKEGTTQPVTILRYEP